MNQKQIAAAREAAGPYVESAVCLVLPNDNRHYGAVSSRYAENKARIRALDVRALMAAMQHGDQEMQRRAVLSMKRLKEDCPELVNHLQGVAD